MFSGTQLWPTHLVKDMTQQGCHGAGVLVSHNFSPFFPFLKKTPEPPKLVNLSLLLKAPPAFSVLSFLDGNLEIGPTLYICMHHQPQGQQQFPQRKKPTLKVPKNSRFNWRLLYVRNLSQLCAPPHPVYHLPILYSRGWPSAPEPWGAEVK